MKNFSRILICLFAVSSLFLTSQAATKQKKTDIDKFQAGSQYLAYPRPAYGLPGLTKAPKGYVPFHIEHYGRHGSRWLLKDENYSRPVEYLEKAARYGKLTPRGEKLLSQLTQIQKDSKGRVGELTPLGHR